MEAVLNESTRVGQPKDIGGTGTIKYTNGVDAVSSSLSSAPSTEKVDLRNGKVVGYFQNTVDMEFDNITFTATQGNLFTKKSAYGLDGIKAIQWGRSHEKDGLNFVISQPNINVIPTGILLTNSGILGASPDGLIGDDYIVKIKCPYSLRNEKLSEKLKNVKNYIVYFNDGGEICLNNAHHYYHQIQGILHILKRTQSYLCIWSLKDAIIAVVKYDPSWEENLQNLETFYLTHYLPKILDN